VFPHCRLHRQTRSCGSRRGNVTPLVAIALVVLIAFMGMSLDIGLAVIGAQRCQEVADASCLAGAQGLPNEDEAVALAQEFADANIRDKQTQQYTLTFDTRPEGEEIPDYGPAPGRGALEVTAARYVKYLFLPVIGFDGITVTRRAMAAHVVTGTCVCPMWISEGTYVEYGLQMDMHACDDPTCQSRMHGIFGWLDPPDGVDFDDALKGVLDPETEELCRYHEEDTVWNRPGQRAGQWMKDLETSSDSRLNRAEEYPWADDTFEEYHADNPRIMIVPFCEYTGGTGNNACFRITRFGAWWLEDCTKHGSNKKVTGRFIDFAKPGGTVLGIKPTHLLR